MNRQVDINIADQGITLVELIVAIVILSVGTIAALRGFEQTSLELGQADARLLAHHAALNRVAELKLLGPTGSDALPAEVDMGPYRFQLDTELARTAAGLFEATIVARSETGVGAHFVTYLTTEARRQ
ncbi:type II secretion system protein [uncultured Litoreibacter sp.]|uniref:type II secretion system protein n=1 Tax=uncultured Litoreibacter sp. TaxID=1392394 RepID=UPI002625D674|nr:prepilin-type N-terminal cleavage/methylation domain-containing protein [uncultured Litoreibacter sp.]